MISIFKQKFRQFEKDWDLPGLARQHLYWAMMSFAVVLSAIVCGIVTIEMGQDFIYTIVFFFQGFVGFCFMIGWIRRHFRGR